MMPELQSIPALERRFARLSANRVAAWVLSVAICGLACLACSSVAAQIQSGEDAVKVSTTWSVDVARPNDQAVLAIMLEVAEGYHIGNASNLIPADEKDLVMPTEIKLSVSGETAQSSEATIGSANFPTYPGKPTAKKPRPDSRPQDKLAHRSQIAGQTTVYVPVKFSQLVKPGPIEFALSVSYQACDDQACFAPATINKQLQLKIVPSGTLGQGCPAPELFARWNDRRAKGPSNKKAGTDYKSKEPPIGPPWVRDLLTAQELALKSGRPIFLYSTKTFCPHCVIVESEMLSSPRLKPHYDKVVWLYVYRDFKGGDEDRLAQRIGDRYSLSSWPQLWLIDPNTLMTLGETGRTVDSFAEAVSKVKIERPADLSALKSLQTSEAQLIAFDQHPTIESAIELIQSKDVVAQISAARFLAKQNSLDEITGRAKSLLAIANDGLRYEVLKAIAKTGASDAAPEIAELMKQPQGSRNPNVLRSHAIEALAVSGDSSAVAIIAPHTQGTARNSTTRVAVKALTQLAQRLPECKPQVVETLAKSFPPVEKKVQRLVESHAKMIHQKLSELTRRVEPFPATYDEQSRAKLIKTWSSQKQ